MRLNKSHIDGCRRRFEDDIEQTKRKGFSIMQIPSFFTILRSARLVGIGATLLLVSACAVPTPPAETTKLKLCYNNTGIQTFLPRYASRAGIFKEYGLEIEEVLFRGAPNSTAALISGEVDLCQFGVDATVSAVAAGADLAVLGAFFNRDASQLIASPDIRSPQDLKGKKVLANRPNTPTTRFTIVYLEKYGVSADEVELVDIGNGTVADRVNGVLTGNASATLVTSPVDAARAVQQGAVVLIGADEVKAGDRISGAITVSRARMAKQRDAYVRFMKAMHTAAARIPSDEKGVAAAVADFSKLDPQKDAELISIIYRDYLLKYVDVVPYPSMSALQAQIDALAKDVPNVEGTRPEKYVDTSIIDELVASGFMKK
jgi:ABC-type nitrate/sulfonate/bicarbonate transport system substrate-binding protein